MNCGIVVREFVLQSRYYVHFRANTLGKGMNPLILPPAMGKQQDGLGSSALVRQLIQEKENSEFKPVKLRLKIDLVSYPARVEGLGKQYLYPERHTTPPHLSQNEADIDIYEPLKASKHPTIAIQNDSMILRISLAQ